MLANNILPSAKYSTPERLLIAQVNGKRDADEQVDKSLKTLRDNGTLTIDTLSILKDVLGDDAYEWVQSAYRAFPTFPECVAGAEEREEYCYAYARQLDVRAEGVDKMIEALQDAEDKEDLSEQTIKPFVTRIAEEPASANAIIRFLNRQFAGTYTDSSFSLYEGDLSFWFFNCDQLCLEFGGWGQRFMIFDLFNSGVYAICIATSDAEGEYSVHFGHWSAAMACMYQHIADENSLQYVRKHGTAFQRVWLPHFDLNPSFNHTKGRHKKKKEQADSTPPARSKELARKLSDHLHQPKPKVSDFASFDEEVALPPVSELPCLS